MVMASTASYAAPERQTLDMTSLKAAARDVAPSHRVESMYVYGSLVRGDNRPDSDVDLIFSLEPDQPTSASTVLSLKHDLEQRLNTKVSLITSQAVLSNARHSESGALFLKSIEPELIKLV